MKQYIGILFVPIGLLVASIIILEKNYMCGIDNHIEKFNNKYNVSVDKSAYCRFEGIQRLRSATGLLILDVIYLLFDITNLKTMLIMMFIYGTIDISLYFIKRKKFVKSLKN